MARESKRKRAERLASRPAVTGGHMKRRAPGDEGPSFALAERDRLLATIAKLRDRGKPGTPKREQVALMKRLLRDFDAYHLREIDRLREIGTTWDEIGQIYDITEQGAQQKTKRLRAKVGGPASRRGKTPRTTPRAPLSPRGVTRV